MNPRSPRVTSRPHGSRTAAAQDLMWALLNSNAFLFNS